MVSEKRSEKTLVLFTYGCFLFCLRLLLSVASVLAGRRDIYSDGNTAGACLFSGIPLFGRENLQ